MRNAIIAVALVLVASLAGCAPSEVDRSNPSATPPAASPTPLPTAKIILSATPTPTKEEQTVSIPAKAQNAVDWARSDVARELGVQISSVAVAQIEEVAWRDSSLGCPQPGMVYLQVITPGYRILLQAGGDIYEYHSSSGADRAILCKQGPESDRRPAPTKPPSDATQ